MHCTLHFGGSDAGIPVVFKNRTVVESVTSKPSTVAPGIGAALSGRSIQMTILSCPHGIFYSSFSNYPYT